MKPFAIDRTNGLCAALFIFFGAFFAIQSLGLVKPTLGYTRVDQVQRNVA